MRFDPLWIRSEQILDGDNPAFATVFGGCTEVPVGPRCGEIETHVSDIHTCERIATPQSADCPMPHSLSVGSAVANITFSTTVAGLNTFEFVLEDRAVASDPGEHRVECPPSSGQSSG